MPDAASLTLTSSSPAHSSALAAALAPRLVPGDVLLLTGDIGAGKTHFARSMIQSLLTLPEDVPSPTYTLVQTYPIPGGEIWHADLYRLSDANEVFELGLMDAFETAICLVEWPDRLGDLTPDDALHLTITPGFEPDTRVMRFEWSQGDWRDKLLGIDDG